MALELFAEHAKEYAQLTAQLAAVAARLMAFYRGNALSRRLARIPGVGPVIASLLAMKVPDPQAFCSGRQFAAWLGLTPKDHSTAGKTRLGVITRAGDETLRSLLVVGATVMIWQARRGKSRCRFALAARVAQTQTAEARGRSARQQDRPDRLEADGDR